MGSHDGDVGCVVVAFRVQADGSQVPVQAAWLDCPVTDEQWATVRQLEHDTAQASVLGCGDVQADLAKAEGAWAHVRIGETFPPDQPVLDWVYIEGRSGDCEHGSHGCSAHQTEGKPCGTTTLPPPTTGPETTTTAAGGGVTSTTVVVTTTGSCEAPPADGLHCVTTTAPSTTDVPMSTLVAPSSTAASTTVAVKPLPATGLGDGGALAGFGGLLGAVGLVVAVVGTRWKARLVR